MTTLPLKQLKSVEGKEYHMMARRIHLLIYTIYWFICITTRLQSLFDRLYIAHLLPKLLRRKVIIHINITLPFHDPLFNLICNRPFDQ